MERENKIVTLNEKARTKILKGSRIAYELVKQAYGPRSGNVALEKSWGRPVNTHDGVSIIRDLFLTDSVENVGVSNLKEASEKTNDLAGDATSATVILGHTIAEKAHVMVGLGFNAMGMRGGIFKAARAITAKVREMSEDVTNNERLKEIAKISSGDEAAGELIADTIIKVGEYGGTVVEEYQGGELEREIVEGLYYDKGFHSPAMSSDGKSVSYDTPQILVTANKISSNTDVLPLLNLIANPANKNKRLVIIGDVSGEALNTLIINKLKGVVFTVSSPAPVYGNQRSLALEDIAILTGAKMFFEGDNLDDVQISDLGSATRVIADAHSTTIIGGGGAKKALKDRIDSLKKAAADATSTAFEKEIYEDRLARLVGKIGIIRVGGKTATEAKELKDRVDDAVNSTVAARDEGIVPGGGITLLDISGMEFDLPEDKNERAGFEAVLESIQQPFKDLMENSGENPEYLLMKVKEYGKPGFGFNAKDVGELINMKKSGIIDPTKAVCLALDNACSAAVSQITTNSVVEFDKDNQPARQQ